MRKIATIIDNKYADILEKLADENKRSLSAQMAYMLEKTIDDMKNTKPTDKTNKV
jgi:hypothetical protein